MLIDNSIGRSGGLFVLLFSIQGEDNKSGCDSDDENNLFSSWQRPFLRARTLCTWRHSKAYSSDRDALECFRSWDRDTHYFSKNSLMALARGDAAKLSAFLDLRIRGAAIQAH
jgi:hypothetical protein